MVRACAGQWERRTAKTPARLVRVEGDSRELVRSLVVRLDADDPDTLADQLPLVIEGVYAGRPEVADAALALGVFWTSYTRTRFSGDDIRQAPLVGAFPASVSPSTITSTCRGRQVLPVGRTMNEEILQYQSR